MAADEEDMSPTDNRIGRTASARMTVALLVVFVVSAGIAHHANAEVWYLLRPPSVENGITLPLEKWEIDAAFDSRAQCAEYARSGLGDAVLAQQLRETQNNLVFARSTGPRLKKAAREGGLAEAVREDASLRPWYIEWLRRMARIPPRSGMVEQMQRWQSYTETPEDLARLVRDLEVEIDTGPEIIAHHQRILGWKCLPTEALPPGMLPLK